MTKLLQYKRGLAMFYDIVAAMLAWSLAFALRFNFQIPQNFYSSILQNGVWVVLLQVVTFYYFGLYRGVWRFASLPDLQRIIKAAVVSILCVLAFKVFVNPAHVIPRSVYVLDPILLIVMMGGGRFVYRACKDHRLYRLTAEMGKPVLIVGAGETSVVLLSELARSQEWRVMGIVDDEKRLHGREIKGVEVLGPISNLPELIQDAEVEHLILALPGHLTEIKKQVIDIAAQHHLNLLTVPSLDDLISGRLAVSQIRKVEVEDLLGRDTVSLDVSGLIHSIESRIVMVSGAGGSIGSELCKQVLKFKPGLLVCIDVSEYALYQLEQSLVGVAAGVQRLFLVRDVKNASGMMDVLTKYRPNIVFHAAAYKHVPMMERHNVYGALENNVLGTYTLALACKQAGVEQFVLISTDKAVNPTNVMGASKRLAEMVCQGLQDAEGTRFVIVRFGNVLGSSGSVIPKFREQIAKGGPVTVTHPEITRYFMSIPEAAQLVMQAGLMGRGGEIFVLDMGEPVKIADLAKNMIHLSGFDTDQIKITYTGLRPGEKLYEELLADDEHTLPTAHPKLRIAQAREADIIWVKNLISWLQKMQFEKEDEIKKQMTEWVSEYHAQIESSEEIVPVQTQGTQSTLLH